MSNQVVTLENVAGAFAAVEAANTPGASYVGSIPNLTVNALRDAHRRIRALARPKADEPKEGSRWRHNGMVLRFVVVLAVAVREGAGERYVVYRAEGGGEAEVLALDDFLADYTSTGEVPA